jgi:hypothetical protein
MKSQLIAIVAALLVVGCGESQKSVPSPEVKPVAPVAEAAQSEPTTAKAPDIPLWEAAMRGNIEAVKQHLDAGADVNAKIVAGRKKGMTPLAIANMFSNKEIADLLRKHGGKTGEELKAEGK